MSDQEFVDRLRQLALAYDREMGSYVESTYQGFDVFEWVRARLLNIPITDDTTAWRKELGPDAIFR